MKSVLRTDCGIVLFANKTMKIDSNARSALHMAKPYFIREAYFIRRSRTSYAKRTFPAQRCHMVDQVSRDVAVAVGVFDQIVLMAVLRVEELEQGLELDGGLLPDVCRELVERGLKGRHKGCVGVVDTCAVLLALVVFSLQILMASVIGFKENSSTRKILQSVKDYADNEEA